MKLRYHIEGNLGSTVAVVDGDGVTRQLTAYYPSGVPYDLTAAEARATDQLHIGNRWIAHEGMNTYDNTARMHYPVLPSFDTPDPLAEQFPQHSPYAHCAANPLMYVDPTGKKLRFAKGASEEFKTHFSQAIQYLNKHNVGGVFAQIEKNPQTIYIEERVGESPGFNVATKTIYWDPSMGLLTSLNVALSPTTLLNHEGGHALRYLENPELYVRDTETTDPKYGHLEERRNISGTEQNTASALGEIEDGQVTREDHTGIPYVTKAPTSIEPKSGQLPHNIYMLEGVVVTGTHKILERQKE